MNPPTIKPAAGAAQPQPAWEIAQLFPAEGIWSEAEYLSLNGNRLIELSNGCVEVLPMPTMSHQTFVLYLYEVLLDFARGRRLGKVLVAPMRVLLWPGKIRAPDVLFMLTEHAARMGEEYWLGADLVMEVVSNVDRRRDQESKRLEYAQAGIPEYWIVDPQMEKITVLRLEGDTYTVHGEYPAGTQACSALLQGFVVDVTRVLAAPSA
jgi:Uma2 family endonuclease